MQHPNHFVKAPCDGDWNAPYDKHRWITIGTNKVCSHCDLMKAYALQVRRDAKKAATNPKPCVHRTILEARAVEQASVKKPPPPKRNPIQPTSEDENGYIRFRANALVRHLLDHGGLTMNDLVRVECSQDDRQQFAQLIGYSLSGYSALSYHSVAVWSAAHAMHKTGIDEAQARIDYLEAELKALKNGLRETVARLYEIAEEDLT